MNKGLEALNRIGNMPTQNNIGLVMINTLRDYAIVEKELKALEIINEKDVDVVALRVSIDLKQYNCKEDGRCPLTQEEYGLLKEVLL